MRFPATFTVLWVATTDCSLDYSLADDAGRASVVSDGSLDPDLDTLSESLTAAEAWDYMVQDVCLVTNASGAVVPDVNADPGTCTRRRNLGVREKFYMAFATPTTTSAAPSAIVSVRRPSVRSNQLYSLQAWTPLSGRSWVGYLGGQGAGYNVNELIAPHASIVGTRDGRGLRSNPGIACTPPSNAGCPTGWSCAANGLCRGSDRDDGITLFCGTGANFSNAWSLFPLASTTNQAILQTALTRADTMLGCRAPTTAAQTFSWRRERFQYDRPALNLMSIIEESRPRGQVPRRGDHYERQYFTREYGFTRWESWDFCLPSEPYTGDRDECKSDFREVVTPSAAWCRTRCLERTTPVRIAEGYPPEAIPVGTSNTNAAARRGEVHLFFGNTLANHDFSREWAETAPLPSLAPWSNNSAIYTRLVAVGGAWRDARVELSCTDASGPNPCDYPGTSSFGMSQVVPARRFRRASETGAVQAVAGLRVIGGRGKLVVRQVSASGAILENIEFALDGTTRTGWYETIVTIRAATGFVVYSLVPTDPAAPLVADDTYLTRT